MGMVQAPTASQEDSMSLDRPVAPNPYDLLPQVASFRVTSADVTDGAPLKDDQVADGGNTSPQLSWSGAPEGTQSFVVTSLDTGAAANTLPGKAFHVRNDGGQQGFMGAAPLKGDMPHRYFFVVHAVSEPSLGVDDSASPAVVSFNLAFKTLARAVMHGTYQH